MARILILDANERSALATTRSLGEKGHLVFVGSEAPHPIAGKSKYCFKSVFYTNPSTDPKAFLENLNEIVSLYKIEVLMPMTDVTVPLVTQSRFDYPDIHLPLPSFNTYSAASDKLGLFKLAERLSIPVPMTEYMDARGNKPVATKLEFPVIVKPAKSRITAGNEIIRTTVMVADDRDKLQAMIRDHAWLQEHPFMLQEKIVGTGQGVFAVYDHGKPVAFFAHRRLREKPPQGGVSVFSESCEPTPRMRDVAETLLTELNWHGAAMVEFKVAEDGTPYLMEINGRLWGSLQLAISAGFDVPSMLVDLAMGKTVTAPSSIKPGVRNRWLLGDLDHLTLQLRGKGTAKNVREKALCFFRFFNFFDRDTHLEVLQWQDPKPFFTELRNWLSALFRHRHE